MNKGLSLYYAFGIVLTKMWLSSIFSDSFALFMIIFYHSGNCFLIIFDTLYYKFETFFLLPEFLINLFYCYAIYIQKKYQHKFNKKLGRGKFRNQQYIDYIKQFFEVIKTQVICMTRNDIVFMNNSAKSFFDRFEPKEII